MSISIEVQGLTEIISRLEAIPEKILSILEEVYNEVGHEMVSEMQQRAPVRTGYLRDHIQMTASSPEGMTIISEAPYSVFVEFGTYKMRAQPFFYPVVYAYSGTVMMRMITERMVF